MDNLQQQHQTQVGTIIKQHFKNKQDQLRQHAQYAQLQHVQELKKYNKILN